MNKCCIITIIISIIVIIVALVVGFLFLFKSGIKYNDLSKNFREIKNLSSKELWDKIGGKVKYNIDAGIFKNTCAIRMSYCFNYGGYEFKQNEYGTTSSGGDGKFYIFRVKDFKSFLDDKYSKNKYTYNDKSKLDGKKGVIVFEDCTFSDATGHLDLFDGSEVEGHAYFKECNSYTLYQFD